MHSFPVILPILIYLTLAVIGITVGIYLIFFLRAATRFLEFKNRELKNSQDQTL